MSPAPADSTPAPGADSANEVRLRGRVTRDPVIRRLPSGDVLISARISVRREPRAGSGVGPGSRSVSDWVDCSAWTARTRRSLGAWTIGDVVEVEGALRRRFLPGAEGPATLVEIEVRTARRVRRASAG